MHGGSWLSMSFLCAHSGPGRKMSRAWPPMSAIKWWAAEARQERVIVEVVRKGIVAGKCWGMCYQESTGAWGDAEARQEKVIVEVVSRAIVVGNCWTMFWTHLEIFSDSTVPGKKTTEVEQSWGAGAELPGRRPPPHWTGRGSVNESIMFGELSILPLIFCLFFF